MFSGIGMGLSLQSPPPILKGATANGNGGTLTLPSHSVGDLIILYASECNGGTGDAMTIPTASGTVPTWTAIGSGGSTWYTHRMYYTVATATNHTSGTWGYSCPLSAVVVSGQHVSNPIYNSAYAGGTASMTTVLSASSMSGYLNSIVIFFFGQSHYSTGYCTTLAGGFTQQVISSLTDHMMIATKDNPGTSGGLTASGVNGWHYYTSASIQIAGN